MSTNFVLLLGLFALPAANFSENAAVSGTEPRVLQKKASELEGAPDEFGSTRHIQKGRSRQPRLA